MKNKLKNYIKQYGMNLGLLAFVLVFSAVTGDGISSFALFALSAASVEIDESNGAGETVSHNITNTNMGSADEADTDPVDNPIAPNTNTYIKYQKIHVTDLGTSSKIDNLKVWRTGSLGTGGTHAHLTNARETSYAGALSYATPVRTSPVSTVDQAMPTSEPSGPNLGIGGSLAGELTATGYSDYLGHQITTDASATAGSTSTMNYQYDETA